MSQTPNTAIAVIGIDIGKNSFHVVGHDARGAIVLRQKWSRGQVEARLANIPPCRIGMEACVGAHHLSRKLASLGHDARLMPAKYVRPYSKGQKNDFNDAEAIAEAVQRPTMKFVATKTAEQLDLQALHRVRERLVSQRTGIISAPSPLRCSATSHPTRPRSPALPPRSLPSIISVRLEVRVRMSSCWRSRARARSASGSHAPASSSPVLIWAAPSAGSQNHLQILRPRSWGDLTACSPMQRRNCQTRKPSAASSSGALSRSTPSLIRRSGNPATCATTPQSCKQPCTACSERWTAGAELRRISVVCPRPQGGRGPRSSYKASRPSFDLRWRRAHRRSGSLILWPYTAFARRRCGH